MSDAPFIVIGGGGHAKSVISALFAAGAAIEGYVDNAPDHSRRDILGVPFLGDDTLLPSRISARRPLAVGLGFIEARKRIYTTWAAQGAVFPPVVHPQAIVCPSAVLSSGVQIMAGAIIQPSTRLGENALLNTGCRVDHDCTIGAHAVVGPGAVLCGNVEVGPQALIGANATVIQNIGIGAGSELGAGAVLLGNLGPAARAFGVPAKERSK